MDRGWSVQETSDGGYIITGMTYSFGAGGSDVYLVKTDSVGREEWNRTFGGSDGDFGWSVQETSDGGYIIAGYTTSFGAGGDDVYLVKVVENRYSLEVVSLNGSVIGEGTYSEGFSASFSVSPSTVSDGSGTRHVFTGWISTSPGGYTGTDNSATVVMDNDVTETAEWKTQYYLTVEAGEGGSASPSSGWYDKGSWVTISATPESGYSFESWSGEDIGPFTVSQSTYTITVNTPITQTATFQRNTTYNLIVTSTYGTTTGEGTYTEGVTATFSVSPSLAQQDDERLILAGWTSASSSGYTGSDNPATVMMNSDVQQVAVWEPECYLSVYSDVAVEGAGWYAEGSTVQLDADSPRGFLVQKMFKKWSGDVYSKSPSVSLVMNGAKSVVAEWSTDYSQAILVGIIGAVVVGGGGYVTVQRRRREEENRAESELTNRIINFVVNSREAVALGTMTSVIDVSEDEVREIIEEAVLGGILTGRFSNAGHTFITDEIIKRIMKDKLKDE